MNLTKILAVALVASLAISGCATRTTYICPDLPEPEFPTVPELMPGALSCVSDVDANRLAERERRIVEHAEDLEVIIQTHNRNCREYRGQRGSE